MSIIGKSQLSQNHNLNTTIFCTIRIAVVHRNRHRISVTGTEQTVGRQLFFIDEIAKHGQRTSSRQAPIIAINRAGEQRSIVGMAFDANFIFHFAEYLGQLVKQRVGVRFQIGFSRIEKEQILQCNGDAARRIFQRNVVL